MMKAAIEEFQLLDWNFSAARTSDGIHAIHPYPAKFIPQIPRELIRLFHPGDSSIVLDPFCGSGTTLVEARHAGLDACGVDINPIACLISRVKANPPGSSLIASAKGVVSRARSRLAANAETVPNIPRLDHWFQQPVQRVLAALVRQIDLLPYTDIRDALRLALSSIVVQVSNQESDTRYAAVEKPALDYDAVFRRFEKAVASIDRAAQSTSGLFSRPSRVTVLERDILEIAPEEVPSPVGLVITSPPYPNAYEYWLYHKYRMYWLQMDPILVREREIGARPHYFKKNHQTEADFEKQMARCFSLLSRVMIAGTYACFVVGRSVIHGREVDNHALLKRAAASFSFTEAGWTERTIASTRKTFHPSHGGINRERVIVFRFEGSR